VQWAKAEPILRRTYALIEENGGTSGVAVLEDMGLEENDARLAFNALRQGGYIAIDGENAAGMPFMISPTEKGLQLCSGWPAPGGASDFITSWLSAISVRAEASETPEDERGRLRRFLDAANGAPKELLAEIATKLIEGQVGL
jgi:hypothetical protein